MPPRKRKPENKGLPTRWEHYHGAYYYRVPPGQEAAWDGKKRFRLGKTLPEAYRTWAERITPRETPTTIADLLDRYALEVMPTKAPATQRGQAAGIERLRRVFSHMPIGAFKPQHAYQYRDKRGRTAPTAANRELEILSHAFTKAIEWGALERHPMIDGKFRKLKRPPRTRYVEDWEIIEALSLPSTRRHGSVRMLQAYIRLKLLIGLRRTDLLRLRMSDLRDDGIHVTPSKTARSSGKRVIYEWTDELHTVLNGCKAIRPVHISPWVFCNRRGECYVNDDGRANGFESIWQRFMVRLLTETKITERFQERDLRAKCATDAESLEHARALLAHASDNTTKRVYRRGPERVKPVR